MTIARLYVMRAAAGKQDALAAALAALSPAVRALEGCHGVETLHDIADAQRFVFIEKWESLHAHKQAGQHLPKTLMVPLMAALDGPPDGSYLAYAENDEGR